MKKKEKTMRMIVNGVLLAAIVVLGVTVYRAGRTTDEKRQQIRQEIAMNEEQQSPEEEEFTVDAGTTQVEARQPEEEEPETAPEETPEETSEETASGESADAEEEVGGEEEMPAEETAAEETVQESVSAVPAVDFSEDTPMIWPLAGDILLDYSMDHTIYHPTLDVYKYNPAVVIAAAVDSPVLSASSGVVSAVAEDAETGTTVTVDMGNGYQSVYGQLKDVQVQEGQTIGESTIIGSVAEPTKYYSTEGSNLYFAMSKDGAPLDPVAYLP